MYSFYIQSLCMYCSVRCLHILNHTRDWWMGALKSWVMLGSVSGEKSYTSLKCGMLLCRDVKWHYPKDVCYDFVKSVNNELHGGGMYKRHGNLQGPQFTVTKENISAGEQTQHKVIKSLTVDKVNVRCVSLLGNLHFRILPRASRFPCLLRFLSVVLSWLTTSLKQDRW